MVILAALVLVLLTVGVILQPILAGKEAPLAGTGEEPSEAEVRKRNSLLQLRDAEYEYAMGKLGEEDYQALRREISAEALAAIRAAEGEDRSGGGGRAAVEAALEEEIAAVRAGLSGGPFCSACGHPNPPGSRFCSECGTRLSDSAPPPTPTPSAPPSDS